MKKVLLLSVLLCGFVLNNGYCFDGEHKITEDDTRQQVTKFVNTKMALINRFLDARMGLEGCGIGRFDSDCERFFDLIRCNIKEFAVEFLGSVIPSGEDKGMTVRDLLKEGKFNDDHMRTICYDDVKYNVGDGDRITFSLNYGGEFSILPNLTKFDIWLLLFDNIGDNTWYNIGLD